MIRILPRHWVLPHMHSMPEEYWPLKMHMNRLWMSLETSSEVVEWILDTGEGIHPDKAFEMSDEEHSRIVGHRLAGPIPDSLIRS